MIGRESDQRERDDHANEDWDQPPTRSLIWPLVITTVVTAFAIGHFYSLRRRLLNFGQFAQQANRTKHGNNNRNTFRYTYWIYDGGRFYQRQGSVPWERGQNNDPWSRFWREGFLDFEELERLERIRRMQEAFNRERAGYPRSYERWQESERTGRQDGHQTGRENWYWGRADWEARQNADRGRFDSSQNMGRSPQAHYHDVLGLDLSRAGTYSQEEIKAAFRAKAMQYHPDRNQHRKDFAEAKFREVVSAYEALKK